MAEFITRYVSANGRNSSTNGETADTSFRTINYASRQLAALLLANPGKRGKILVEPGVYEENIVITNHIHISRNDEENQVEYNLANDTMVNNSAPVHIKRPANNPAQIRELIKITGNDIVLKGLLIDGDQRPQRGVLVHRANGVLIEGCKITGCHTRVEYVGEGSGTENDPYRNSVRGFRGTGAGLRINQSQSVTIRQCHFINNSTELKWRQALTEEQINRFRGQLGLAWNFVTREQKNKLRQIWPVRNGGGNISCAGNTSFNSHITIEHSLIEQGVCGGRGGGIQLAKKAYCTIESCRIRNNKAFVDGGGIAVNDPDIYDFSREEIAISNSIIENNISEDDGGGVYMTSKTHASISNCQIQRNRAGANGGGVRATFGSLITIADTDIDNNEANTDASTKLSKNLDGGGGVAGRNCTITITGGTISNNRVHGFAGGGVYFIAAAYDQNAEKIARLTHGREFDRILKNNYNVRQFDLTITDTTLQNNEASGNTCYAETCTLSPLEGFRAGGAGGAVYTLGSTRIGLDTNINITGVQVLQNLSRHGDSIQQSEMVFNGVNLTIANETITKHSRNSYSLSLIDVESTVLNRSRTYVNKNEVYEE